jgi:hypothetical protein
MATTDKAWNGDASRWPDAKSFCDACLLDLNPDGQDPVKSNCKLPVREPNGDINTNALSSAAAVLNGGMGGLKGVAPKDRKAAARKLIGLYQEAQMPPPDSLKKIAGM